MTTQVGLSNGLEPTCPAALPTAVITTPVAAGVVFVGVVTQVQATVVRAATAHLIVNGVDVGAMTIVGGVASINWTPSVDDETTDLVVRVVGSAGAANSPTVTVDAQQWSEIWVPESGLVSGGGLLTTWTGIVAGTVIVPDTNAPDVVATFAGRAASAVQCVAASSEAMLANAMAGIASGDDTPFTVVTQNTFESMSSGETLWSFGATGDAVNHIRLSGNGPTVITAIGRGAGDGANVTGAPNITVANATEYVLRAVRTAPGVRIGLAATYTDVACAIGDLGVRNILCFGALKRDVTTASYCDCTIRRIAVKSGTMSDSRLTALRAKWLGN